MIGPAPPERTRPWRLRLQRAPLVIPDPETDYVEVQGHPVTRQGGPRHQQVFLGKDQIAAVARFPCAWTTPDFCDAVMQQAVSDQLPARGSLRRRSLPTVTFRMPPTRRRNDAASKGFGMKAMHPARLSSFASSAGPEVTATTGIPRVPASVFNRWTTFVRGDLRSTSSTSGNR